MTETYAVLHLEAFAGWLRAAARPESTIYLRTYQVRRIAGQIPNLPSVDGETLTQWLGSQAWKPDTKRSYRSALTIYFGWLHASGRITSNPTLGMPIVTGSHALPRPATDESVQQALATADDRVRLMIRIQATLGLRRGEVARVHTRDVVRDFEGHSLRILGKGSRERLVPLPRGLAAVLLAQPAGWLFPSPAGGPLTPAHVGKLISRALGPGVTPHQLRHRFATRAYAQGQDLLAVQQLLGHARPETTMIYTQVPTASKRFIVDAAA
ncbi:tyrosine-type recombinase/integrase [Ornithinimicrobium sp. Arc0846-15]|nr:tyrosine-type recombinase/integrase [Ornithinimicrobium laminariae]